MLNDGKIVTSQTWSRVIKIGGINTMRQENQLIFFSFRVAQDTPKTFSFIVPLH
jgi:hypothetical protein